MAGLAVALSVTAKGGNVADEAFRADDEAALAAARSSAEEGPFLPGTEPVPDIVPSLAPSVPPVPANPPAPLVPPDAAAHEAATGETDHAAPAEADHAPAPSPAPHKPQVALTFDDGPTPYTLQILEILKARNVKATFFMVGDNIKRHPAIAKAVVAGGFELGNHTMHHPLPDKLTDAALQEELAGTSKLITALTGKPPSMFRSPYGSRSKRFFAEAAREDMKVVFWNVDPYDWKHPTPDGMVAEIVSALKPGAIILLHDGGGNRTRTVLALPPLLDEIERRGYEIVLVSEIDSVRKMPVVREARPAPAKTAPVTNAPVTDATVQAAAAAR